MKQPCQHKPILDHVAPALVIGRCESCRRRWWGNPMNKNAPRWVTDAVPAALEAIAKKGSK